MDSIEPDCSNDEAKDQPESSSLEPGDLVDSSEPSDTSKGAAVGGEAGDIADQPAVEMKEVEESMGDALETDNQEVPASSDNVVASDNASVDATAATASVTASSPESASNSISPQPGSPQGFAIPHRLAPPPPPAFDLLSLVTSAVSRGDFNGLLARLEEIELESNNGVPSSEVFACMIATYLIVDDVVNGKMAWKRISPELKSNSSELESLWNIGKKCWSRDYSGLFVELNKTQEWSPHLTPLMSSLASTLRDRVLSLVEKSYKSVRLTSLSSLLGLTNQDSAMALASERDWPIEQGFTFPLKSASVATRGRGDADDALARLTEYVSFLEE